MIRRVECATAFILAGGRSTRMGRDKAFLQFAGKTLLERALALAAAVAAEVCIVGEGKKFFPFGKVVEDVFPGCGPLGGIHAALRQTESELNLMLAVDLPFVEAGFLQYLLSEGGRGDAVVIVPDACGGRQPLCAVYRKEFAGVAEDALRRGIHKIDLLFAQVETRVVEEKELAGAGFSPHMFRNLNTLDEFEQAEQEMVGRRKG